jgi:FKBP-type peptidyl-prolyl cis-trans isomerase FklB
MKVLKRNTTFVLSGAAALMGMVLLMSQESARAQQGGLPQGQLGQPGAAAPAAGDAEHKQQLSYMLGQNFAQGLKQMQIDCELASLVAGIQDTLSGAQPKYTEAQLEACRGRFEMEMQQKMQGRMQAAADKNQKAEQGFLAKNKAQEGVQTTPSGLQYKVIRAGSGATPSATDTVTVHYKGTLIDGTEFDSSLGGEPASFPVNQVIPGWTEALQKMKVGDKWQLVVPAELAYGAQSPGPPIEPNSTLIFEVELLGVQGK